MSLLTALFFAKLINGVIIKNSVIIIDKGQIQVFKINHKFTLLIVWLLMMVIYLPAGEARAAGSANAAQVISKGKIVFIPHDDRPTSGEQTAAVVRKLGYEVAMPDKSLLGSLNKTGDTDLLWQWLRVNAKDAKAAVIATDSLIYGGLVNSRKHEMPIEMLKAKEAELRTLHEYYPEMKLYAFGSLMRTPKSGEASGGEDPAYYINYGSQIFRYTALMDKAEMTGLNDSENAECMQIESEVPAEILQDWFNRRQNNLAITMAMVDDVRRGAIDYLLIGKDDNAPLSETHRESRWLSDYAHGVPSDRFRLVAGIDEFAMLLLSRAINDVEHQRPKVYTEFNAGKGGATVPAYSDEKLADTLKVELAVAGAVAVPAPAMADYVLLVNTPADGITGEANHIRSGEGSLLNDGKDRAETAYFLDRINKYLAAGYKVGIADVAFTNGSDNALMNHLQNEGLLFRLRAYSGWNTATNSLGFALGQGILAARLPQADCNDLLKTRYLDDWLYQANVRTAMGHKIEQMADPSVYLYLGSHEQNIAEETAQGIEAMAKEKLPLEEQPADIKVAFPWHRMFIADIEAK